MGRWGVPGRFDLESPESDAWLAEVARSSLVFTNHVIKAPAGELLLQVWRLRETATEPRVSTEHHEAADYVDAQSIADAIEAANRHRTDRLQWTSEVPRA